jgi:Ca2+-binding RTX toxin-like protein
MIMMVGGAGNDNLSLNETNGAMPAASIFGGDGNDVLIGGSGIDFIDGGPGNDMVFLGAEDDTFQWNPGDGSDVVEGQGGRDTLVFNGSDDAEKFDISDSGNGLPFHRVRLTRDVGNVTLDLNGVEEIDLNAFGGADSITVNDQTATDMTTVNLDLSGAAGTGDGQTDVVILNGTDGDDLAQIAAFDNGTRIGAVVGLFPFVNITGAEGTNDTLTVNALGGDDTVDASFLPANLIGLSVNGGAGNDTILGSLGSDLVNGGPGDDVVWMGDAHDQLRRRGRPRHHRHLQLRRQLRRQRADRRGASQCAAPAGG